jgi:hypothetical protein
MHGSITTPATEGSMKKILLSTLALALLTSAAPAAANTYDVYSCWAGAGTFRNPNASSAAWTLDQANSGSHFAPNNDCGLNSTSGSMSVVSLTGDIAPQGQYAGWNFAAPAGTTLATARLWRRAWTYGTGSAGSSQRNYLYVMADGALFSSDSDGGSDAPYGTRGTGDSTAHGINNSNLSTLNLQPRAANRLAYRVGCGFAAGCPTASASGPYPNYFASGVEIFGAVVSISDTTAPTLDVGSTGLFAGDPVTGIRNVAVNTAADATGIKKLAVFADGSATAIGVLDYEQDVNKCSWWKAAPCQNVSEVEIPVDTRQLMDGEHSFVVKAFDAAGNERASTTHYVTVKNSPPSPTQSGGDTPSSDTPAGGSGSTGGTSGLPNGIGPDGASGPAIGGPQLTISFDQNNKSKLAAKYGRTIVVRGHLADGGGGPIGGAQIAYSAQSTKAGARVQNLGSVRTDSTGGFTLSVATKLGSRQLRFAYSPQLGGPAAVTAQAQLDVVAPVTFRVGPKHVHNKHAVVFAGKLKAGPMPRKGKLVNLQVVVDGRWHTFATVRSTKSGKFKYRYRFMRTYGLVTYRFRALSRYEAAYPFVAGHSKTVRVHVNG